MALKGGSNQSYWVRCSSASKHHATFFFDNKSLHRKYKYSIPSYQIIQYAALRTQFAVTFVDRKMIMHPRLAHYNTFYCSAWWGHIATSSSQKQILHLPGWSTDISDSFKKNYRSFPSIQQLDSTCGKLYSH